MTDSELQGMVSTMRFFGVRDFLVITAIGFILAKRMETSEVYSFCSDPEKEIYMHQAKKLVEEVFEQEIHLGLSMEPIKSAQELLTFLGAVSILRLEHSDPNFSKLVPSLVTQTVQIHAPRDRNVQRDCALALTTFIHAFGSFLIK